MEKGLQLNLHALCISGGRGQTYNEYSRNSKPILNKVRASVDTWPISNAFCFSFDSTHCPIQMKTSPCVSSIIMSSVNKSSWEKLKISVT